MWLKANNKALYSSGIAIFFSLFFSAYIYTLVYDTSLVIQEGEQKGSKEAFKLILKKFSAENNALDHVIRHSVTLLLFSL